MSKRTSYPHGVPCWVLQRDERWARLRVIRPDGDALAATGARCYERGVYESSATVSPRDHPNSLRWRRFENSRRELGLFGSVRQKRPDGSPPCSATPTPVSAPRP